MKKLVSKLMIGLPLVLAASCMEVDNFDGPEARFTGRIIDVTTGENILADQGDGHVRIWEKSYSLNPSPQDIPIKQDGTFNNSKLFNGTYDVVPEGAWWPADTIRVGIGGTVEQNFEVTPYLSVVDFQAELCDNNDSLAISCALIAPITQGLPMVMEVRPYLSLNSHCGAGNAISYYVNMGNDSNRAVGDKYCKRLNRDWSMLTKDPNDPSKTETYHFKVEVKAGYTYYVRCGAKVRDDFENHNYSEIVRIDVPQE